MTAERFLNTYHNASTAPGGDVPADLASFMLAADPVLADAAELARVLARAHQGAATQLIGEGWAHAPQVLLPLGEIRRMGGLPSTGQGIWYPRIRTRGQPADPADRRGAPRPRRVAELRRPDRQPPSDAWLAGRSPDRIGRGELRVYPGLRSARG
jgi:hypothetical protein